MSDLNNPTLWEISCETSHDGIDVLETIDVTPCPNGRFVHIDEYQSAIDRLMAERDSAVADAERYHWLRSNCCMFYPSGEGSHYPDAYLVVTGYGDLRRDDIINEAIDAAMKEQEQGK